MPLEEYLPRHGTNMGNLKEGEERINEHWRQNHPLHLAKNLPVDQLKKVKYYIDCGENAASHTNFELEMARTTGLIGIKGWQTDWLF